MPEAMPAMDQGNSLILTLPYKAIPFTINSNNNNNNNNDDTDKVMLVKWYNNIFLFLVSA